MCFCHPAVAREDRNGDLLICKLFPSEFSSGYDEKPRFTKFPLQLEPENCRSEFVIKIAGWSNWWGLPNRKMFNFESRALTMSFKVAGLRDASDYLEFNFVARWKRGAGAQPRVASLWCKFSFCCVLTRVYQNPTSLLPLIFCFVLHSLLFNFFSFHFEKFLCLKSDSPQVFPVAAVCREWKTRKQFERCSIKKFSTIWVANAGIWSEEVFKWRLFRSRRGLVTKLFLI